MNIKFKAICKSLVVLLILSLVIVPVMPSYGETVTSGSLEISSLNIVLKELTLDRAGNLNVSNNRGYVGEIFNAEWPNQYDLYVKENSKYRMEVQALNASGTPIANLKVSIEYWFPDDIANPTFTSSAAIDAALTTNALNIETKPCLDGFTNTNAAVIIITDSSGNSINIPMRFWTYKGTLGLFNVQTTSGGTYTGEVAYNLTYTYESGGAQGANANTYVYDDGYLPVPFIKVLSVKATDLFIFPINDGNSKIANSKNIDINDLVKVSKRSNGIYNFGTLRFQEPTLTIITKLPGDEDLAWGESYLTVEISKSTDRSIPIGFFSDNENGDGIHYLAELGGGYEFKSIQAMDWGVGRNIATEITTLAAIGDREDRITLTAQKCTVTGAITTPSALENKFGAESRGVDVLVTEIVDGNRSTNIKYYFSNDGYYYLPISQDGTYSIIARPNSGDFDDLGMTQSDEKILVIESGQATWTDSSNVEPVSLDLNGFDEFALDIPLTPTILKGYIKTGTSFVDSSDTIGISIYDSNYNEKAYANVHASRFMPDGENEGLFLIPPFVAADKDKFTLYVSDPQTELNYTGTQLDVNYTSASDFSIDNDNVTKDSNGFYVIQLPESKVTGNISLEGDDNNTYSNNFSRIYVNIFDEYDNYIMYGRVSAQDGAFAISNLEEGRYYAQSFVSPFAAIAKDYMGSYKIPFEVGADGAGIDNISLPLKRIAGEGYVYNSTESDTTVGSSVWVKIFDSNMNELCAVSTNDDGMFQIPFDYEEQEVYMKAYGNETTATYGANGAFDSKLMPITITSGMVDVSLYLTGPTFEGSVSAGSSDVGSEVEVFLLDKNYNVLSFTTTDMDGQYAFGGLGDGTYYVQAIPPQILKGYSQSMPIPITVENSLVDEGVGDISLPLTQVSGYVLTPTSPAEFGTGWVWVFSGSDFVTSVKVIDGFYSIGGLDLGVEYTLQADGQDSIYASSNSEIFEAEDGPSVSDFNLILKEDVAIRGQIDFEQENVSVYLYDSARQPVAVAMTNVFGEFGFDNLDEGTIYLIAIPKSNGEYITQEVTYNGTTIDLSQI